MIYSSCTDRYCRLFMTWLYSDTVVINISRGELESDYRATCWVNEKEGPCVRNSVLPGGRKF